MPKMDNDKDLSVDANQYGKRHAQDQSPDDVGSAGGSAEANRGYDGQVPLEDGKNGHDGTNEGTPSDEDDDSLSLATLPTMSDDGVKYHIDVIQDTFNIQHVIRCHSLLADLLHIAMNSIATDAPLLVKVQESMFDTIKLSDSVSLMLQSHQIGASDILEKLKIAYLYLLDGFPDFAKSDIELIAKNVKSMDEGVEKCVEKIKGAKGFDEEVLEMLKDKQVEVEGDISDLVRSILKDRDPNPSSPPTRPMPTVPTTTPSPRPAFRLPWLAIRSTAVYACWQMQCQVLREMAGFRTHHVLIDLTTNHAVICLFWPWNQHRIEQKEDRRMTFGDFAKPFAAASMVYAMASKEVTWRQFFELAGGWFLPAFIGYRGIDPRSPFSPVFTRRDMILLKRFGHGFLGFVAVVTVCMKLCGHFFKDRWNPVQDVSDRVFELFRQRWQPAETGVAAIPVSLSWYTSERRPAKRQRSPREEQRRGRAEDREESEVVLPRKYADSGEFPGTRPDPEMEEELRKKRADLEKKIETWYNIRLAVLMFKKSLPLLDGMCDVLGSVTELVKAWYTECGEIIEPSMQKSIDQAEGLSAENLRTYWDSVFFKKEVRRYYERWRALQVICERTRPTLKKARQVAENHYTENLYPRDAVRRSWELAAEEPDDDIKALVEEKKAWLAERRRYGDAVEDALPAALRNLL